MRLQLMLFIAGVFFVVGAGITGGAVDVAMLVIGRLVIGVGLGLGCMVCHLAHASNTCLCSMYASRTIRGEHQQASSNYILFGT